MNAPRSQKLIQDRLDRLTRERQARGDYRPVDIDEVLAPKGNVAETEWHDRVEEESKGIEASDSEPHSIPDGYMPCVEGDADDAAQDDEPAAAAWEVLEDPVDAGSLDFGDDQTTE